MKHLAFLGITAVMALGGCATVPPFPEPDASWQSYSGQLQYVTATRSVIGEFTASVRGGDFRLEFSKGGAVPLMRLSRHEAFGRAEGPLARGQWQGNVKNAPKPLEGWIAEVPRAFSSMQPLMLAARTASHATANDGTGRPKRMEITGVEPGERFVFIFNR